MRAVVGSDAAITSPFFVNGAEEPTAADVLPTVSVTAATGAALAAPVVAVTPTVGRYTATLTAAAHTPVLDSLTLVWTATVGGAARRLTQSVDVVAARLFTIAELRAEPSLESVTNYPTALLAQMRDECEDYAERVCGVAFNPRYTLERIRTPRFASEGRGRSLRLSWHKPRAIRAVSVNGAPVATLSDWRFTGTDAVGCLSGLPSGTGAFPAEVAIAYEHGYDYPPPKLVRECLRWCRREVLARNSHVAADVLSDTVDGQTTRYALPMPREGRPTGVLALDPVLTEYTLRTAVA